jgi:uncharacterized Zn finger protein
MGRGGGLFLWLGFRQANDALALLELSAFAEKVDALKTLQNTTLGLDGAFAFETGMLAHKSKKWRQRMVTDLQESNPNSSENLQEQIPASFESNGHSTENDNATFISPFVNFFSPIRLVR